MQAYQELLMLMMIILPAFWWLLDVVNNHIGMKWSRLPSKYHFRGTSRQQMATRIEEQLEGTLGKRVPIQIIHLLRRAGMDSVGDFLLQLIVLQGIVVVCILVIFFGFPKYAWTAVLSLSLLFYPFFYIWNRVVRNERNLVFHAPIFTSVISREFARYRDMEQAFRRAAEESQGWCHVVFTKMVRHMDAVKGDVEGALQIFRSMNDHSIADQFIMSVKQGMATNRISDAMGSVAKQALLEKKKIEQREAKKKDSIIFINAAALFLVLIAQVAYYAMNQFSIKGF